MLKRTILCGGLLLSAALSLNAQTRVKLEELVRQHEQQKAEGSTTQHSNLKENSEKGEYQFQRWLWQARQHTDQQGYLVPQIEALRAWKKYEAETTNAKAKATAADQSDWKAIGPFSESGLWLGWQKNGMGRINTMAFHPTNADEYIVGTAGGGAWITKDDGYSWKVLTENMMSSAVSDIDFNPQNPNTIYICTGDKETPAGSSRDYNSIGVIKSYDGGATWDTTNITTKVGEYARTNALLINRLDTNSMTLASDSMIIKSYDGGNKWENVTPAFGMGIYVRYIYELVYHPIDTNIIYTACTIIDVPNQSFYSAILRSSNGGVTWSIRALIPQTIGETPPRAAIAVTKSNPNLVKVVVADMVNGGGLEGIYSSNNSGGSFVKIAGHNNYTTNILCGDADGIGSGGQGYYDLCIAIDPLDIKHIIVGGVNSWESRDSGYTWTLMTQWAEEKSGVPLVHADHHFTGYHPLHDSLLFDCNDGGIYVFRPKPLVSGYPVWIDLTVDMDITQYYRNAVSDNASFVLGGAQDNGTTMIDRNTSIAKPVGPGDGMECQIDPTDPNIVYVSSQNGSIFKWDLRKPMSWGNINFISFKNQNAGQGAWTTPFLIDPNDHNRLYTGYKAIFTSPDQGETWTAVSSNFSQLMNRLSMTKASAGTIYATEETGANIHYTHDTGNTWITMTHPYSETMISDILVDHKNSKQCWITFPGYGNNKTKVAMYKDGTWTTMNENLPDLPVYCIVQDTSNGTLYIGTYTGIYYRTTDMTQWEMYSTKHPMVNVYDIGINYKTGELVSATWGRGMWASPKYEKELGIPKGIPYAMNTIELFPNPSSGRFTIADNANNFGHKQVQARLIDVTGKTVWQQAGQFGAYTLNIDITGATSGTYVFEIIAADGKTAKERIVIR